MIATLSSGRTTTLPRVMPRARDYLRFALMIGLLGSTVTVAAADLSPGGTFIDDDNSPHQGDIEAIAAAGITRGCNPPINDRLCPGSNVTRGQMAAFLHRALG